MRFIVRILAACAAESRDGPPRYLAASTSLRAEKSATTHSKPRLARRSDAPGCREAERVVFLAKAACPITALCRHSRSLHLVRRAPAGARSGPRLPPMLWEQVFGSRPKDPMRGALSVVALAGALAFPGESNAHARLISSSPRPGEIIAPPKALSLTFSSRIDLAKSAVVLTGPHGAVRTGALKLASKAGRAVTVPTPTLAPGDYKVRWSMRTEDTHTMSGNFGFKVK